MNVLSMSCPHAEVLQRCNVDEESPQCGDERPDLEGEFETGENIGEKRILNERRDFAKSIRGSSGRASMAA
jgi:hypothetical protein